MFTIGVHTQIISEDSVPRNQHIRGFVLLLLALSCLQHCLCVSFEPQVIPAFFPTIYARLPPHFAPNLLFKPPSGISVTIRCTLRTSGSCFSLNLPPPSPFEEPLSPP